MYMPVSVAERSKACTVYDRLNIEHIYIYMCELKAAMG
jgi:hypothetical protein